MAKLFALLLALVPACSQAQRVLDLPQQAGFSAAEVNAYAARTYGARLRALRAARRLDPDPALKERLQRLMARLERAAAYEVPASGAIAWEIHACSGCDENASSRPGGKLLVSAEFIARLQLRDEELAYLLAHEMGHVLAQHAREFASAARYFVDNGARRTYGDIENELGQNLGVMLRMQPVSVQQELEADYIGFVLGAHAGFAPEAMLGLLRKLAPERGALVDTHPSAPQRLEQARAMLDAMRRLAARPVS
ncbi:MAG TPA: M48 family metalloprotease [Burkholderiales bacterium]|nr:M48 family metalloprotease [Burkholderiales bacterium]